MTRVLRVARRVSPALLIAVYTLAVSWIVASAQLGPRSPGPPDRVEHDGRFEDLREELEALKVDSVGFVQGPRRTGAGMGSSAEYFRAQYALAPVIVRESTRHRYVVGDFRSSKALEAYLGHSPLSLVARYEHGLALLRNDGAP